MPQGLAFGFAMVVFFFEDWLPHEYYSHTGNPQDLLVIACDLRTSSFF
jgi:hypothetical protein